MKIIRKIRNFVCYCGIEKEEYNAVKKEAFKSNFEVWRLLHCFMTVAFAFLFIHSVLFPILRSNRIFYLILFLYSLAATGLSFVLKKDSVIAQWMIYLSITMLFLFGCSITQNKPDIPAATFFVLMLITPMFMINKPYYMGIELILVSVIFSVWMYYAKPYAIWEMDFVNVIIYMIVSFFIHIIANSIRIKEFVLTRKINIQKDTDELTGLKNKSALTRAINEFLADASKSKGIMLMLDIDDFKMINDTFGHDKGDEVIHMFGTILGEKFKNDEIVGRFGGDEFIVFIKNTDDTSFAEQTARDIIDGISKQIVLPDNEKINVSIGIALYHGEEKNYSEIFKKADIALYRAKADRSTAFNLCQ